jgi:hypothetical protein
MGPYVAVLYQIVAAGQKANSYKFALWRALATLAAANSEARKSQSAILHRFF